ncbi:MAG: hypothetical protein HKN80_08820 [Acidimicrobiia bacterium]|nr:hypothetical protein [Acidimicrobiia bacterium]
MGQIINVTGTVTGDSAIFEADRSLSGQDGESFESIEATVDNTSFPARLAARVFAADTAVSGVFTGSNGVVIQRRDGWSEPDVARIGTVIEEFFVFYRD